MADKKTLFKLVVDEEKVHQLFNAVSTSKANGPTRWMLDEVFQSFDDPDGNFLEQFQSTGFNTRYFELYLHAYLTRSGYAVDRTHPYPDFIVKRSGLTVAVEATTVNPSTSGVIAKFGKVIKDLSPEELLEYQKDELAIRFGSPLTTKLGKKYWEQNHCKGLPFVIAIEAFHDEGSLAFSDHAVSRYVFGIEHDATWDIDGVLNVEGHPVVEHTLGEKKIPSSFFDLPGADNVSAVLFTNSGTNAKFSRMGFLHGQGNDEITIHRWGTAYDELRDARDPMFFSYDLDNPPLVETWGEGLVVMHNPKALKPIPRGWFVHAIDHYMDGERMASEIRGWHPMMSNTEIAYLGEGKKELQKIPYGRPSIAVVSVQKREFQDIIGIDHDLNPVLKEVGWYRDTTTSFLGVVVLDWEEKWGWVVLARNLVGRFAAVETDSDFESRDAARTGMVMAMLKLLSVPQRYFEQGNDFD